MTISAAPMDVVLDMHSGQACELTQQQSAWLRKRGLIWRCACVNCFNGMHHLSSDITPELLGVALEQFCIETAH